MAAQPAAAQLVGISLGPSFGVVRKSRCHRAKANEAGDQALPAGREEGRAHYRAGREDPLPFLFINMAGSGPQSQRSWNSRRGCSPSPTWRPHPLPLPGPPGSQREWVDCVSGRGARATGRWQVSSPPTSDSETQVCDSRAGPLPQTPPPQPLCQGQWCPRGTRGEALRKRRDYRSQRAPCPSCFSL